MRRFIRDSKSKYLNKEAIREYILEIANSLDEDDILVLVTRKGYWFYVALLEEHLKKELKNKKGIKIFSDRYFTKCINFEELLPKKTKKENVKLVIFDDTMNSGVNLFFFYAYFSKQLHKEFEKFGKELTVIPYTYALNTMYDLSSDDLDKNSVMIREYQRLCRDEDTTHSEQEDKARRMIKKFNEALNYKVRLTMKDINKIREEQVEWFEGRVSPMVMDLPIVSEEKSANLDFTIPAYIRVGKEKYGLGITMTEEQFEKLTIETENWRFVKNNEELGNKFVECSFFQFKNRDLFFNVQNILHDCVVKCEYRRNRDGSLTFVFVPFAIVKSMSFRDVLDYFFILLEEVEIGSKYKEKIYEYIKEKTKNNIKEIEIEKNVDNFILYDIMSKDHNLCRNMYRTIIFYLSYYIYLYFFDYVKMETGIELGFDWKIMEENFTKDFIDGFRECVKNSEGNLKKFQKCFLRMPKARAIDPIDVEIPEKNQKKLLNEKSLHCTINHRISKGKNRPGAEIRQRVYMIETMIEEIERSFLFKSHEEERAIITKQIIGKLKVSKISNEIYVDNTKQVIYRGFRYGENSELDTPLGGKYFYAYVYAFYYYMGIDKYQKYYADFAKKVETLFYAENYMDTLIKEDIFCFFKDYFGNLTEDMIENMIMGRAGILHFDEDGEKEDDFKYFVNCAFDKLKKWRYKWE